ncbi:hypothetical protein OHB12_21795 [Nocardia sp. NBC_01730]|uniref:hypothetical protein n=1 Tax=Nocardia sp. NBC_01730 TaxID=2975998 RepID=UPI002E158723|nr:hypothetical protein OHB12_21795 [Nocardia sp. NBC_01730]
MRIAIVSATVLTVFTAAVGATATLGVGSAAAAEPIEQIDQGRIGLHLNHEETTALADGPIPAIVTMLVPLNRIGAGLKTDTGIYRDGNGGVHASLRQVVVEAASHPDGTVTFYLNAPGTRNGRVLDIYQNWS